MMEEQLIVLMPQIILVVAAIVVLLSIAIKRSQRFAHIITGLAFVGATTSLAFVDKYGSAQVTPLFVVDGFSYFFTALILLAALVITLFSTPYFGGIKGIHSEEYYVLLLIASLGATTMTISNNLMSFFLGLELMSVPLYALIAYLKKSSIGIEAGIKYLIMAAVSAAILLFGFALIYAQTGEMQFDKIAAALAPNGFDSILFMTGMAMVLVGLGFKLALFPFHLWTPDIYAGAPAPVSAFVSTISKGSVFAFLLRFFYALNGSAHSSVWIAFAVLSVASMLVGNWLALRQKNIKRLLAYSSIGHLGYLLIPLLAGSADGVSSSLFYFVTYFLAMLGAFGIVSYLSAEGRERFDLEDYRGLYWKKPWIAALMTAIMLSLAGIPLTAGFMGKFYLLLAGVGSGLWALTIILVIASGISIYYYLRVVFMMFSKKPVVEEEPIRGHENPSNVVLLGLLFLFILYFGIFPSSLLQLIQNLTAGFL